jgi:hypothetical protein
MPIWNCTFEVKDLLSEDDSPAEVRRVALVIHERMEKEKARVQRAILAGERLVHNPDAMRRYADVSDEFHSVAVVTADMDGGDVDWFNGVMDELYDWADDFRVWIG